MVLLKIWAKDGCEIEKFRPTVENIFVALYKKSFHRELRDAIQELLKNDNDFAEKGSKLHELAKDVITKNPR